MYYFYLARCNDGSLYSGYTNNIKDREKAHNEGKGAKYTKAHLPVKIVYFEKFRIKTKALKREVEVKKFTKQMKEELIYKFKKTFII